MGVYIGPSGMWCGRSDALIRWIWKRRSDLRHPLLHEWREQNNNWIFCYLFIRAACISKAPSSTAPPHTHAILHHSSQSQPTDDWRRDALFEFCWPLHCCDRGLSLTWTWDQNMQRNWDMLCMLQRHITILLTITTTYTYPIYIIIYPI